MTKNTDFEKEKLFFQTYILNLHNKLNKIIIKENLTSYDYETKILNGLNGLIVHYAFQSNINCNFNF